MNRADAILKPRQFASQADACAFNPAAVDFKANSAARALEQSVKRQCPIGQICVFAVMVVPENLAVPVGNQFRCPPQRGADFNPESGLRHPF